MKKDDSKKYIFVVLRISMAFIFLWAFFDKLFGLGIATTPDKSWLAGASPTLGFLSGATTGPFAAIYQSIAGQVWVDILFMSGLLLIGLALLLGIGLKITAVSGTILMLLMWSAILPPKNNPLIDDHIIYAIVFIILVSVKAGDTLGLGKSWKKLNLVKKYKFLE